MAGTRVQTVEVRISGDVRDVLTKFQRVQVAGEKLGAKIDVGLTRKFSSLGVAVGSAVGAFAGFQALDRTSRFIFDTNVEFEKLQATLKTVTGSAEGGRKAFALITDFARTTPFEVQNLTDSFIALRVRGFDPTRQELTGLGNFAAAFTRDITDLSDAVVSLAAGMVRPIRRFGVDAHVAGNKVTLSFRGVTQTVDRSAKSIAEFLAQVGNTRFPDAMSERMKTLDGQLSNLSDTTHLLALRIGEAGLNGEIANLVKDIQDAIDEGGTFADTLGHALASGVHVADEAFVFLDRHIGTITKAIEVLGAITIARTALPALKGLAFYLRAAAGGAIFLTDAVEGLGVLLTALGGPEGLILAAAAVLLVMSKRSRQAADDTDALKRATDDFTRSLNDLSVAQINQKMDGFRARLKLALSDLQDMNQQLEEQQAKLEKPRTAGGQLGDLGDPAQQQKVAAIQARITELKAQIADLQKSLATAADALRGKLASAHQHDAKSADADAKAIAQVIQNLEDERDKLQLTSRELLIKQLREKGATDAEIKHALIVHDQIELEKKRQEAAKKAAEAAAAHQKALQDAYSKFPEAKGPLEKAIDAQNKAIADQKKKLANWEEQLRTSSDRAAGDVADAFLSIIQGTKSVTAAVSDMVSQIIAEMLRLTVQQTITAPLAAGLSAWITHALGGAGGVGAGKAAGGTELNFGGFAARGAKIGPSQYVIGGEAGPEIVYGPATVVPINPMTGGRQIVINVDARGSQNPAAVREQVRAGILEAAPAIAQAAENKVVSRLRRPRMA